MAEPTAELTGEVALVTGGGRGVGRVIALALARAGARVAVASRTEAELEQVVAEAGASEMIPVVLDVTDERAVPTAVAHVEAQLGPTTLLVNNAGTLDAIGPLWEASPDSWRRDVETTLHGAFNLCRAVVPGMVERRRGRVVNVSSGMAVRAAPFQSAYAAANAALLSVTEALAAETATHGLAVFAITPGQMPTRLVQKLRDEPLGKRWLPDAVHGQWVPVERLERLVTLLASGRGDALSGRFIHALDDVEELVLRSEEVERQDLYAPRLRRI